MGMKTIYENLNSDSASTNSALFATCAAMCLQSMAITRPQCCSTVPSIKRCATAVTTPAERLDDELRTEGGGRLAARGVIVLGGGAPHADTQPQHGRGAGRPRAQLGRPAGTARGGGGAARVAGAREAAPRKR
eukprot:IDg19426t1